ncbi:MAG: DUF2344 domain-containing protein [Clostridiales bacterium]|nr:DUF2344 domain-containing protein [Clostridiales bacterium]
MYKLRLKFYKKDDMVFISHLDLIRLFERAFRRSGIPISYTQGFNPRPIMAFATALGIGVSSDSEYMDIEIEDKMDVIDLITKLNEVLPTGIKALEGKYIDKKEKSLMSIINFSSYTVDITFNNEITRDNLENKLKEFLGLNEIIDKKYKKRRNKRKSNKDEFREVNIRQNIKEITIINTDINRALLKMILAAGSSANLKPEIVIEKFKDYMKLDIDTTKTRVHRTGLFTTITPEYLGPLDIVNTEDK